MTESFGELNEGENHPQAHAAFKYVKERILKGDPIMLLESLSSVGLSGNRSAEVCAGTLDRIIRGQGVGERYVFGLAWMLKEMEELER